MDEEGGGGGGLVLVEDAAAAGMYTGGDTLSLHDALPIWDFVSRVLIGCPH